MRIQLTRPWDIGREIGSGGFGHVYEATAPDGTTAAIKLVPMVATAMRELEFTDLDGVRNIVPIWESGEADGQLAFVMPRAEKSLRDVISATAGPLPLSETLAVLKDITIALVDLDGRVVHRDLKPDNVLWLAGAWCLADFGIARYADAVTATVTHKRAKTRAYAAPEQWRDERATGATDVYALGVMAYTLLAGHLPFQGPTAEDFRHQHLAETPPPLVGVPSRLSDLVEECLLKAPEARPTAANVLRRLEKATDDARTPRAKLMEEANRAQVVQRTADALRRSHAQSEQERRTELARSSDVTLGRISQAMSEYIDEYLPAADLLRTRPTQGGWVARLDPARLNFSSATHFDGRAWAGWEPPKFDVVSFAQVSVSIPADRSGYEGRSHSLWFCDLERQGEFGWYEIAFMLTALSGRARRSHAPFALRPGEESAKAFWNGMAEYQLAWGPDRVELDELGDFTERWAGWLAADSLGRLTHPLMLPEHPLKGYRQ